MANTLTFANQTITDANIFGGISYTVDLNAGDEFSIGNTASACVSFETDTQVPLYSKDSTNGVFTWEQDSDLRGTFYVTEVTKGGGFYTVTAYDAMYLTEKNISALSLTLPISVSNCATAIATYIGCTVSGTIINGSLTASELDEDMTIRDLLGRVAEASGCSVKIDGASHLCFMYYADSGITVTASEYIELEAADYACAKIDNVTVYNMAGEVQATAGTGGNSLFIGQNPFMEEATNTNATNIFNAVKDFQYTPLTCSMFEENGIEVGTIATFGTTPTLVMSIESGEEGATVTSVGSDTRAEYNKDVMTVINETREIAVEAQTLAGQAQSAAAAATTAAGQATSAAAAASSQASAASAAASAASTAAGNAQSSADAANNALKSVVQGATTVEKAVSVMQTALEAVVDYDPQNDTVDEYFWHDANGAHVLGTTGDYRADIKSTGMNIVDTATENPVATFGTETSIRTTDGTELAHFGYDLGQAQSGTAIAPYYTLGKRENNSTIGNYSVAEGVYTTASGTYSHAENNGARAYGFSSHAEGMSIAEGAFSHGETVAHAQGNNSHAEGASTASGEYSHTQNFHTIASSDYQTALGKYNDNQSTNAFEIGNGNGISGDPQRRSNAFEVDWSGNVVASGDITDGSGNVLSDKADASSLATVATSGSYNDLSNKPTIPKMKSGHETYSSIATNSYADKTISFGSTFDSAPNVVACLSTTGTAGNIGNVSVSVHTISKTGATIRVFNNRGSALSPAVEWIAVGL